MVTSINIYTRKDIEKMVKNRVEIDLEIFYKEIERMREQINDLNILLQNEKGYE